MVVVSVSDADEALYEREWLSQKMIWDVRGDENCEFSGQDRLFYLKMQGVSGISLR